MDFSITDDFDGTGHGNTYTISSGSFPTPSAPGYESGSSYQESSSSSSGAGLNIVDGMIDVVGNIAEWCSNRYQEQKLEAERRAEEEERRKQREEAARIEAERLRREAKHQVLHDIQEQLNELDNLERNEPNIRQRLKDTQELLKLEKRFEQARMEYAATMASYAERLRALLNHPNVPPLPKKNYERIFVGGTYYTPDDAQKDEASGKLIDTFNNQRFDRCFGFGMEGWGKYLDILRAALDHQGQPYNRLSEETAAQLWQLRGVTADEVVCHSNGYPIVKLLIESGELKVNKLRILGGDNVLMDIDTLEMLKKSKKLEEVSVWAIKGDPVTVVDLGWKMASLMPNIGNPVTILQCQPEVKATLQVLGVIERPKYNPNSGVKVQMLSPVFEGMNPVDWFHAKDTYLKRIGALNKCEFLEGGCLSPKSVIH